MGSLFERPGRHRSPGPAPQGVEVPVHLGVDEKAFAKRDQYMTLVCDLETKSVEHVADGRSGRA